MPVGTGDSKGRDGGAGREGCTGQAWGRLRPSAEPLQCKRVACSGCFKTPAWLQVQAGSPGAVGSRMKL